MKNLLSTHHGYHAKLALVTFLLAFVVILLGAYTRLTDAGLSCPDWPHCYGYITAPHTPTQLMGAAEKYPLTPVNVKKAWTEMTHRYFAGTEGILILVLSVSILLNRKAKDFKTKMISLVLIAMLAAQVMLGMLTVTEQLKPVIVLAHLIVGLFLLSLLWWTCLDLHLRDDLLFGESSSHPTAWLWVALLVVILQITLGGWVSTHYAGLACIDLPYCNGQLLPNLHLNKLNEDLVTIHMLHRIGAVLSISYLGILSLFLLRNPFYRSSAILILALLAIQLTLGTLNIIWLRPVWIALLHHGTAILLLLTIITALVKATFLDNRYGFWTT